MTNHPNLPRAYDINITFCRNKPLFQHQRVQALNDAEILRTATALVRLLELDGATNARAEILTPARREVGSVQQDGRRVLAQKGAEYQ